jgi:hypothetical protein
VSSFIRGRNIEERGGNCAVDIFARTRGIFRGNAGDAMRELTDLSDSIGFFFFGCDDLCTRRANGTSCFEASLREAPQHDVPAFEASLRA